MTEQGQEPLIYVTIDSGGWFKLSGQDWANGYEWTNLEVVS